MSLCKLLEGDGGRWLVTEVFALRKRLERTNQSSQVCPWTSLSFVIIYFRTYRIRLGEYQNIFNWAFSEWRLCWKMGLLQSKPVNVSLPSSVRCVFSLRKSPAIWKTGSKPWTLSRYGHDITVDFYSHHVIQGVVSSDATGIDALEAIADILVVYSIYGVVWRSWYVCLQWVEKDCPVQGSSLINILYSHDSVLIDSCSAVFWTRGDIYLKIR